MNITQSYKYKLNNIVYVSENVPEGATILETMDILNAEEGYKLERISDKKHFSSVWLKDGDTQENYIEVKAPKIDIEIEENYD